MDVTASKLLRFVIHADNYKTNYHGYLNPAHFL